MRPGPAFGQGSGSTVLRHLKVLEGMGLPRLGEGQKRRAIELDSRAQGPKG